MHPGGCRVRMRRCRVSAGRECVGRVKPGLVILSSALLLLLGSGPVVADDTTDVLSAIAEFESLVLKSNRELSALEQQLEELEETISEVLKLDDSSVSMSGGYSYNPILPDSPHRLPASASVTVPVLPQISIDGHVNSSGEASLTLEFTPLAALGSSLVDEQQLATQRLTIMYKQLELQWQSRIILLQYAAARKSLENAEEHVNLGQQQYEHAENQFDAGLISRTELRTAADDLAGRSANLINVLQQESEVEKSLYQLVGAAHIPEEILSIDIDTEQLLHLITDANAVYLEISDSHAFTSLSRQTMQVQKHFLEEQLKSTWFFEPGVSISVSGSLTEAFDAPVGSAGANVNLQLSAESFNFDEIQQLRDQFDDLERDLQIEQIVSRIDEQNAKRSLEAAELSAGTALRHLDTMDVALEQAAHDLEQSSISEFEYSDIVLSGKLAETGYLNSLIGVYSQLGSLLQSYADEEVQSLP